MWEYKFAVLAIDGATAGAKAAAALEQAASQLNAEGQTGWEVIAVFPNMGQGNSATVALLKRPKRQARQNPK